MSEREQVKLGKDQPTRRGSDYQHPFMRTVGFRTCLICGLARNHKIHDNKSPRTSDERMAN